MPTFLAKCPLLPLLCLWLGVFMTSPALAWNAAGHRLAAALAWQEMVPAARARAVTLLRQHPDYPRWLKRQREGDPDYGVFLEAATWPDDIRRDARFHDAREAATPLQPGFPHMLRQEHWHFLNPEDARGRQRGEIDRRVQMLAEELQRGTPTGQAYALPWFLHLLADLHQPLHTAGREDGGGNGFDLENPFNPRFPMTSLHRYWDDLPGPPWLRGKKLQQALRRLQVLPRVEQGQVASWLAENRQLVAASVYPPGSGASRPRISLAFHRQAHALADDRLAAAGRRLGHWLNLLWGVSRGTG